MSDNKVSVKNRSSSMVVYTIPEKNIRREFMPAETKVLPYDELVDLSFQAGGRSIMENFLQVQAVNAREGLNLHTEPEYNMSEEDIKNLLLTGSNDALLDALDFAPIGVIDLIKQYAVSLPVNDMTKRQAIKDKTGFDVTKALAMNQPDPDEKQEGEIHKERRVKPAATTPQRRTTPEYEVPTYNVVAPKSETLNTEE